MVVTNATEQRDVGLTSGLPLIPERACFMQPAGRGHRQSGSGTGVRGRRWNAGGNVARGGGLPPRDLGWSVLVTGGAGTPKERLRELWSARSQSAKTRW